MSSQKPILGYWNIRGLAQPIRLLLKYTGTEFVDKYYECGEAPDFDRSQWTDVKYFLGLDFPNLPYYIDGETKVTQSNAILRYIGRQHDLCGTTEQEKIRIDMLENQSVDVRTAFTRLCYNPGFENLKSAFLEGVPDIMKSFSSFLGDYKWFAGQHLSFVDFLMYELLEHYQKLAPDCLTNFKNLQDFLKHFEELDRIKSYISSDGFLRAPLNNKQASFGNK